MKVHRSFSMALFFLPEFSGSWTMAAHLQKQCAIVCLTGGEQNVLPRLTLAGTKTHGELAQSADILNASGIHHLMLVVSISVFVILWVLGR
jgi:hypothetical protein